jgi:hypothetical protein
LQIRWLTADDKWERLSNAVVQTSGGFVGAFIDQIMAFPARGYRASAGRIFMADAVGMPLSCDAFGEAQSVHA